MDRLENKRLAHTRNVSTHNKKISLQVNRDSVAIL